MANGPAAFLKARKQPRQRRASATVETIFEAAIQVLIKGGLGHLTTTRVAERAGVSVGTIYQYFPNKHAMLYGFLERHVTMIGDAVVNACDAHHGVPLVKMAEALVEGYILAKKPQHRVSQLLYSMAEELQADRLTASQVLRVEDAVVRMLESATETWAFDVRIVAETLVAAVIGTVRMQFNRDPSKIVDSHFQKHVRLMCSAYIEAACEYSAQPELVGN